MAKGKHRNLRIIPQDLLNKVSSLGRQQIFAGCTLQISESDLNSGLWKHLGLPLANASTVDILPPTDRGRFSRRNLVGFTITRRDLPKVPKTFCTTVPNWGDWLRGSHEICQTRLVYPKHFFAPHEATLKIEIVRRAEGGDCIVRIYVDDPLDPSDSTTFAERLLWNLNILLENVGAYDVFPAGATAEQSAATLIVEWELIPVGVRHDDWIRRILPKDRFKSEMTRNRIEQRCRLLEKMQPRNWLIGVDGFRRYFGAQFADDLVAFENVEYGNAIYVMFENWGQLSHLSRTVLMDRRQGYERIEHRKGWELRLQKVISAHPRPPTSMKAA